MTVKVMSMIVKTELHLDRSQGGNKDFITSL
jgi:hypothetical protein